VLCSTREFQASISVISEVHVCCRCVDTKEDDGSKYLAAFIVSMALQGFGAVPLYVLGVTYLDDASPHGTASVHIGIVYVLHHLQGDHWWPSLVGGAGSRSPIFCAQWASIPPFYLHIDFSSISY